MPEITILESDKTKKNLENLSEDEREFAIMQMSKQVSYIPDKYWDSFAQMITKNIHRKEIISNIPTMRELIFRNIISVSKSFVENKMPYFLYKGILPSLIATRYIVTPIIEDFTYKLDISKKEAVQTEDIFSSYSSSVAPSVPVGVSSQSSIKSNPKVFSMPSTVGISKKLPQNVAKSSEKMAQGGAFRRSKGSQHSSIFGQPKLRRNILEKDIKMSIRVRFEYPVCCVTETGVFYTAPTQEEISVIGFALGNMCGRIGNDFMPFLIELIKMGVIGYEQLASNCIEDVILQTQATYLQPVIFPEINPLSNMFLFSEIVQKVDEEMYVILNDLISKYDFSYSLDAHRISNEIATNVAYSSINSKLSLEPEKLNQQEQTEQTEQTNKKAANKETTVETEVTEQILDVIYKATGYKPRTTYYDSFVYTLRNANALDLFHKCLIFGKDSKVVKSAIENIKNEKMNALFLSSIEKKLTEANYKASVVFSIVKTLFGENRAAKLRTEAGKSGINGDLVLDFLTSREREYVTNELKRRESYLLAISGNKCPHIGVLRRLRGARSDEENTRAYNELKGFFPKGILGGRGLKGFTNDTTPHTTLYTTPHTTLYTTQHSTQHHGGEVPKLAPKMIKCEVCKFDLICPHVIEIIELKTHKMPPNQIRAAVNKYIDDKPLHENYYCKICGEFLVTSDIYDNSMTESDARTYSNIADELKTLMWSEIAGIIKYLDVSVFINIPKLISSIITGIYDFIFEIEKQLIRSKTNTADDVNNKKKLFIVVYAYAYIIDMIMKSEGAIKFKTFANIDKPKPSDLVQFVKYAVITIINTKNIIINQIANITTDQIVEKIRDAYKNITALKHKKHDIRSDEEEMDIYGLLYNDPIYRYYYYANMLGTNKPKKKLSDMQDKISYIMGDNLDNKQQESKDKKKTSQKTAQKLTQKSAKKTTKNDKPLFEIAKAPSFVTGHDNDIAAFETITKQSVYSIGPEMAAKLIRGYKKKAFLMFYENIRKRLFSKFIFEKDTTPPANRNANSSTVEIPRLTKELIELENAANKVKLCETFLYNFLNLSRVIGVNSWEKFAGFYESDVAAKRLRDFFRIPIKLGNLFDENGTGHNFGKFVFNSKDGKTQVEVTSADLGNKAQKTSSIGDLGELIGRKCSICGVMENAAATLNESTIRSALKNKTISENFFKFYLNRCPETTGQKIATTTHNWVSAANGTDNECSQCKLLQSTQYEVMLSGKQNQESKAYYEKYRESYLRELAKDIEMRKSEPTAKPVLYKVPSEIVTKLEKWSFNYNNIADLSSQLGFNTNAFMCIGAHEKVEYEDIKSGKFTPNLIENYDNTRFNSILGYIQLLISEYNTVRYYHFILKPSDDIKNIIESSQIKKHEISELEHLAEIGTTFSADYKNARLVLRPNSLIEYLLETLALYITAAANGYSTITKSSDQSLISAIKNVCKNFATEFVKKMLRSEELKTAYTQINWNVFKLKDNKSIDDVIETEKYDTNLDEEAGIEDQEDRAAEDEKDEEKDEEKDDERGDTLDIMKNKFDIDLDPDQDFEEFDNEIGEESELL